MEGDPEADPNRNPNRNNGNPPGAQPLNRQNRYRPQARDARDWRRPQAQQEPQALQQPQNVRQPRNHAQRHYPNFQRGNQNRAQSLHRPLEDPRMNIHAERGRRGHRHHHRGMNRNGAYGSYQSLADHLEDDDNARENRSNYYRDQRGRSQHNRINRGLMGFKALEELANADPLDILGKINQKKEPFLNLVGKPVESDMHILITQILSKICLTSFDELKLRLLLDVCNSGYVMYLSNYLMELPYTEEKQRNRFYWNNENDFWKNLILFCETIFNKAPSVAMQKCRSLIEMSSKLCLEELDKRHGFSLSMENSVALNDLRERVSMFEKKNEDKKQARQSSMNEGDERTESEPPDDFRKLSVIPSRDELLDPRPYLRANLVTGGYRNVEHYLDVQFRLLREDCFGPLRDGLFEFIKDPKKQKYDNMRVYRDVKFIGPYVSASKSGVIIQLDGNTKKRLKKINWTHSKRFIFGSLLLFSKDNCNSFITATVLDRDVNLLTQGQIPITVVENTNILTAENIITTQESYIMFESEVYFEPYFHVLKALQDPGFAQQVAMSKYIVDVEPTPRPPEYLNPDSTFEVETLQSPNTKFKVLDPFTWPSHEELDLNESQFQAYKLALTHEFAVIQGPPGTGKTYLGVKVARTLLENILSNGNKRQCLMLIICYTNHALDQFLEHILDITKSIVRIGNRSRNEAMEMISINNLRKASTEHHSSENSLYLTERRNLKNIVEQMQTAQKQISSLSNGILTYNCLCQYVPQVKEYLRGIWPRNGKDKLTTWLFQSVCLPINLNIEALVEKYSTTLQEHPNHTDDNNTDQRTAFDMDDLWKNIGEIDINGIKIKTSFMLDDAIQKIQEFVKLYRNATSLDDQQNFEYEIQNWHYKMTVFKVMRNMHQARGVPRPVRDEDDLARLPNDDRWSIYFTWVNTAINGIRERIAPLQEKLDQASVTYEEARMNLDLHLLRGIKVVGMTTSGAARLRKLLKALAPPIVIVEEAAEVLEQHIVTSLTRHCKHLILIGDHQQLRPSAAYMKLASHYDIEVSLFERMIRNNMHSRRLRVQHRMRPEISALIAPHIYPDLENHPSVEAFPRVRGITTNLFFFTHDHREKELDDSSSRTNPMEADMTLSLANYLMQQGYEPGDITILAAYSGQMFYMRKQRASYAFLDKVKITVVDNYQGEEAKIILLSLVRNNTKNIIGFLGTENRICVALSRAKEGFYIFGNIDILKAKSPLWTKIAKTLENGGNIGTNILLKCENHPNEVTTISSVKDFERVPEGGCQQMCNLNLSACGHPCPQICHGYDRGHKEIKCLLQCERVLCELGHVCPLRCAEPCKPCEKKVTKSLPCGHVGQLPCHVEPSDSAIKCLADVTVRLAPCGHETKKQCYMDVKNVKCPVPCTARVEACGHTCRRLCHVTDDPDHEKYICQKACAKAKKGCKADLVGDRGDHQCMRHCHETCDSCDVEVTKKRSTCKHSERVACHKNVDDTECRKKCARMLPCGHFCLKKCFEPCGDCNEKVEKVIPECGHRVKVACKVEVTRAMCPSRCARTLECGHACARRCASPCRAAACARPAPAALPAPCGHAVRLPCGVYRPLLDTPISKGELDELLLQHCTSPCGATLRCDHVCAGSCAGCRQGRLHQPCASRCHVTHICGHQCEEPCNQVCPPCKKPCEVKCPHSHCPKLCGAPCVPCQEACSRECPHGACTRRCGEPCGRAPCSLACARTLPCGHACRGLCGEPCPPVCRLCRPDDFPRDFLGDEFDDDAKFIQLEDCTHIMEVDDADNLMNGDRETISIRTCPFCRKPIINTHRYKDRVNEMYRHEINPIKERVYGKINQVKAKKQELVQAFDALKNTHAGIIQDNVHFRKAFEKLQAVVRTQSKMSLLQLEMHFLYINILEMMGDKYEKFKEVKFTGFNSEFLNQIMMISEVLVKSIDKISQQQQEDIGNELKRMGSIIQLAVMFGHKAYESVKTDPKVAEAAKMAKAAVLSWKIYNENIVMDALKNLQEAIKVSGIVTREERDLIVKAIGLKQGHWYKCPNGHFYAIGECGGAMEVSKCIECGAPIGGQRHSLLSGNRHAPEMDGSSFAAWSEEYNNMANFAFDHIN